MKGLDEIKAAAAKLDPDEQVELFRWWVDSDGFKKRQLAALKRDLSIGLGQLDTGQYKTYDDTNIMQLAEEIGKRGRQRIKAAGENEGA
jgi:hypothetical protein